MLRAIPLLLLAMPALAANGGERPNIFSTVAPFLVALVGLWLARRAMRARARRRTGRED